MVRPSRPISPWSGRPRSGPPPSEAGPLGLTTEHERLYQVLAESTGANVDALAATMQLSAAEFLELIDPLIDFGAVTIVEGRIDVATQAVAAARYLDHQAHVLMHTGERLAQLAATLPTLPASATSPSMGRRLDGERVDSLEVPDLMARWIKETRGELRFLRPDQWQFPSESEIAVAVGQAVQRGCRARAIYPARALAEAEAVLMGRAALGEEIRILPEVSTRLAIIGSRLLVPEPLGVAATSALAVRQSSVVQLAAGYFDLLWDSANVVGVLERGVNRHEQRRLLLQQLASGAKDENISRALGISLRTVRRRIADLLTELGVDTRFQAGVEAARRGWL